MSLRKYQTPRSMDLPRELVDVLTRNGMQAAIVLDSQTNQPKLMVQGHDSPVLTYNLTSQQLDKLTQYGSNFSNKQAYNTFTDIVQNDFDLPKNYVHARNVNTRVAMGLHGYREHAPEYGYGMRGFAPWERIRMGMPFGMGGPHRRGFWQVCSPGLAWGARMQDGFHLRRMNGMLVTPNGAPIVPERRGGHMRPGELQSGAYGFYWKGNYDSQAMQQPQGHQQGQQQDPLKALQQGFSQVAPAQVQQPQIPPRSTEPAKKLNEVITSPVYFSAEKWQDVLASHGLHLDTESKTLTVQSEAVRYDVTLDVKPEDMEKLMSNSVKDHPVAERVAILNNYLTEGFTLPISEDFLNTEHRYSSYANESVRQEISVAEDATRVDNRGMTEEQMLSVSQTAVRADGIVIPIISEKEGFHWQQDIKGGRDVVVGNVVAFEREGKQYLYAQVNGVALEKELTKKEFQDLHYKNDDRRLELIDKHLDGITLERGDYKGEYVNVNVTHGADIEAVKPGKGWYREGSDGRAVTVGEIKVEQEQTTGKYRMTAIIDGQAITHEISAKDYNKFVRMDDYHRMRLFSKIFDEVDLKNDVSIGTRVGAAVAATLTVLGELAVGAGPMRSEPRGMEMGHGVRPYYKPGVDSPAEVAARYFEAEMNTEMIHQGLHRP